MSRRASSRSLRGSADRNSIAAISSRCGCSSLPSRERGSKQGRACRVSAVAGRSLRGSADRNALNCASPTRAAVAPFAGARIETDQRETRRHAPWRRSLRGSADRNDHVMNGLQVLRESLPSRERGSKPWTAGGDPVRSSSLPSRERGSKPFGRPTLALAQRLSLPSRERGSKRWTRSGLASMRCGRSLRGSADRNTAGQKSQARANGRSLRGSADRNLVILRNHMAGKVAPFAGARIETLRRPMAA